MRNKNTGFTPLEMQSKSNDSLRKRQRRFLSLTGFTPLEKVTRKRSSLTGFTLVEIVVALVILLFSATGIFASFIAANNYIERAKRRITAINFARQEFEGLKLSVRQDTWASGALKVTDSDSNNCADDSDWTSGQTLSGEFVSVWGGQSRYCVSAAAGQDYRKVRTKINWTES